MIHIKQARIFWMTYTNLSLSPRAFGIVRHGLLVYHGESCVVAAGFVFFSFFFFLLKVSLVVFFQIVRQWCHISRLVSPSSSSRRSKTSARNAQAPNHSRRSASCFCLGEWIKKSRAVTWFTRGESFRAVPWNDFFFLTSLQMTKHRMTSSDNESRCSNTHDSPVSLTDSLLAHSFLFSIKLRSPRDATRKKNCCVYCSMNRSFLRQRDDNDNW